jgi:folate-binding protein YgfZ
LNTQIQIDDLHIVRLPGDRPRLQVIGPVVAIQSLWQQGIKQQASPTDAQAWRLLDIRAGLPMIYLATSEAFVPQMTNLQLVGGVSFKKGCYTGQEVVARMHYLGKQKRQMYRVQIPSGVVVQVGQALYATDTPEQSVGAVLEVAPVGLDTGYEALVVCQIKSMENATSSLYLEGQTKAVITDLGLPYSHATS